MGWIVALIVGGIAGWLASMVMNRDNSMGIMLNIIVGCVGSVLGNLLLNQFGIAGSVQNFSLTDLLVAVLGAVVLLGIVNLVRRGFSAMLHRLDRLRETLAVCPEADIQRAEIGDEGRVLFYLVAQARGLLALQDFETDDRARLRERCRHQRADAVQFSALRIRSSVGGGIST